MQRRARENLVDSRVLTCVTRSFFHISRTRVSLEVRTVEDSAFGRHRRGALPIPVSGDRSPSPAATAEQPAGLWH